MRQKDSLDRYIDHDLLLEQRLIWIGSNVRDDGEESGTDAAMSERLIKSLNILQLGAKAEEPITIQMANLGGVWHHGMAMYDAIRACRAHIKIECFGFCMSAAAILLQAADERILHANCRFMIHDGEDGYVGKPRDFEAWARESNKLRRDMYRIFAERSGQSVGYWSKRCAVDYIMSSEEAVREGLADSVVQPFKKFDKRKPKPRRKPKKA